MLALVQAGAPRRTPRVRHGLDVILSRRRPDGRWNLDFSHNGKMIADVEMKGAGAAGSRRARPRAVPDPQMKLAEQPESSYTSASRPRAASCPRQPVFRSMNSRTQLGRCPR